MNVVIGGPRREDQSLVVRIQRSVSAPSRRRLFRVATHQYERRRLDAIRQLELVENVVNVTSNGAFRHEEATRNLAIGDPFRHQFEHLVLPCRKAVGNPIAFRLHFWMGDQIDQTGQGLGRQNCLTLRHEVNRFDQVVDLTVLGDIATRASANRLIDEVWIVAIAGQDNDLRIGKLPPDGRGRLNDVTSGHVNVEKYDLWLELACQFDRFGAIGCFANHNQVVNPLQERAQTLAKHDATIDEEKSVGSYLHLHCAPSGDSLPDSYLAKPVVSNR